jgi:hypothetical protein
MNQRRGLLAFLWRNQIQAAGLILLPQRPQLLRDVSHSTTCSSDGMTASCVALCAQVVIRRDTRVMGFEVVACPS